MWPFRHVNVLFLGDEGVGKSSLLVRSESGAFPKCDLSTLTLADYISATVTKDRTIYAIDLWDTARGTLPPETHLILFCFAVDSCESLINLRTWMARVSEAFWNVPYAVVGTKSELRAVDGEHSNEGRVQKHKTVIRHFARICGIRFPTDMLPVITTFSKYVEAEIRRFTVAESEILEACDSFLKYGVHSAKKKSVPFIEVSAMKGTNVRTLFYDFIIDCVNVPMLT